MPIKELLIADQRLCLNHSLNDAGGTANESVIQHYRNESSPDIG